MRGCGRAAGVVRCGGGRAERLEEQRKDPRARTISGGTDFTLMVIPNGRVASVGSGAWGQLGHGTLDGYPSPRVIMDLNHVTVVGVSAGGRHSLARTSNGQVMLMREPCFVVFMLYSAMPTVSVEIREEHHCGC